LNENEKEMCPLDYESAEATDKRRMAISTTLWKYEQRKKGIENSRRRVS
jgi:hypothetical protein